MQTTYTLYGRSSNLGAPAGRLHLAAQGRLSSDTWLQNHPGYLSDLSQLIGFHQNGLFGKHVAF